MSSDRALPNLLPSPTARAAGAVVALVSYLGGLALLAASAARSVARPPPGTPPLSSALVRQADWILGMGLPLVALVHVGMGSFLVMQAYYGATFVEAAGPVVGVGLCRNMAPMLAGMALAGLLAARIVPELRRGPALDPDDLDSILDRDVARGRQPDPRTPPTPGQLAAARIGAAAAAGPILGLCGVAVGTAVGWAMAHQLMGIPTPIFFAKMFEMLWLRDAVGLIVKGAAFGAIAALVACFEGLRGPDHPRLVPAATARAACISLAAILLINNTWYILMYMAGPAFGPTVLPPPAP